MTNWITRLLALLFFSSLAGLTFLFFFLDIAGWIQIPGYAIPPVLCVFYMFFSGYAKKGWIVALMLAATTSFNIPLQNWLFHSADDIVEYKSAEALYQPENKALRHPRLQPFRKRDRTHHPNPQPSNRTAQLPERDNETHLYRRSGFCRFPPSKPIPQTRSNRMDHLHAQKRPANGRLFRTLQVQS